jgi:hypothetical protein
MFTRNLIIQLILIFFSPFNYLHAAGFQDLPWGTDIYSIQEKFSNARFETPSEKVYPICNNQHGETYLCTIAQSMCEKMGRGCHPSLLVKNYQVGTYPFTLTFEFSRENTLHGVSLSYSNNLIGQSFQEGKSVHMALLRSLEGKYGKPTEAEPLEIAKQKIGGAYSATAFYQWKNNETRINFIFSGRFDTITHKYVDIGGSPNITIIYSPLIDEAASKL